MMRIQFSASLEMCSSHSFGFFFPTILDTIIFLVNSPLRDLQGQLLASRNTEALGVWERRGRAPGATAGSAPQPCFTYRLTAFIRTKKIQGIFLKFEEVSSEFCVGFPWKRRGFPCSCGDHKLGKGGNLYPGKDWPCSMSDGNSIRNLCQGNILELVWETSSFVALSKRSLRVVQFLAAFLQSQLSCQAS